MDRQSIKFIHRTILIGSGIVIICFATLFLSHSGHIFKSSDSLPAIRQEAYVWQRVWTDSLLNEIGQRGGKFDGLIIQGAEATIGESGLHVEKPEIPYHLLKSSARSVGLAVRIGPYFGEFSTDDEKVRKISGILRELLEQAAGSGVKISEIQIDFDCATSNLANYGVLLTSLRKITRNVPLTFTVLPSWLDSPDFESLVRQTDGFVLQVHGLHRDANGDLSICDPESAQKWTEKAGRLGKPFRIALPTYGHMVEGRSIRSDPGQMAGLIRKWSKSAPENMRGVIWFRLPVPGDSLNWQWRTLEAVMAGRTPLAVLKGEAVNSMPGLWEIELVNTGDADSVGGARVVVRWEGPRPAATDALYGFNLGESGNDFLEFTSSADSTASALAPGSRRAVGWIRFYDGKEIKIDVQVLVDNYHSCRRGNAGPGLWSAFSGHDTGFSGL